MKSLEFDVKTSFTMHGFAGYFETVLYGDIMLSKSSVNNNVYLNMALKRDFCAWSYLLLGASSIISMQHAQPFSPIRASLCFLLIQLSAVLASGCRLFTFSVKKIKFSLRYVLFHLAHFYRLLSICFLCSRYQTRHSFGRHVQLVSIFLSHKGKETLIILN